MTTTAPPLTGQDINLAAHATRTLLISQLEPTGLSFEQWIVVNLVGTGQADSVGSIHERLSASLGLAPEVVDDLLDGLDDGQMLDRSGDRVGLTPGGAQRWNEVQVMVAELVASLYAGIDAEEMAATRRVLVEVTERARARLDA